jgi:hypothetical protein
VTAHLHRGAPCAVLLLAAARAEAAATGTGSLCVGGCLYRGGRLSAGVDTSVRSMIARQGLLALRLALLLALAALSAMAAEPHSSITFGCSDANLTEGFECALRRTGLHVSLPRALRVWASVVSV